MSIINAGGQQVAQNPNYWQPGVPTMDLLDGYTKALTCSTDLKIAHPCFKNPATNQLQQTKTSGCMFYGIVRRANTNVLKLVDSNVGFSEVIAANQTPSVIVRATVPVYVALANESGAYPLLGSMLYAMDDGTFETQTVGGTAPANSTPTNFRVSSTGAEFGQTWTAGGLIEVTNIQNVGA